jgi:hypothetical protein
VASEIGKASGTTDDPAAQLFTSSAWNIWRRIGGGHRRRFDRRWPFRLSAPLSD